MKHSSENKGRENINKQERRYEKEVDEIKRYLICTMKEDKSERHQET